MFSAITSSLPGSGRKARRRRKTSKEERVCPLCRQAFKKAEHLSRHLRSHTKEKPFSCHVCDKKFTRQDTLLRHSRCHAPENGRHMPLDSQYAPVYEVNGGNLEGDLPFEPCQAGSSALTRHALPPYSPPNSIGVVDPLNPNNPHGESTSYSTQTTSIRSMGTLESTDSWTAQLNTTPPTLWDFQFDPLDALLTGDEFDLNAVNDALLSASSTQKPTAEVILEPEILDSPHTLARREEDAKRQRAELIRKKWFTFDHPNSSQTPSHRVPEEGIIDEQYREGLSAHLQSRVQHGILPSTPFLDLCFHVYFSKFHPLFPIIHTPTFRPSPQNSLLLLSICAAGSLFIGSSRALSHGISMSERLNKSVLSKWESLTPHDEPTSLQAMQGAIIGQTFCLLVGRPQDLTCVELWHGSIIAWARKGKLFQAEHGPCDLSNLEGEGLEQAWLEWIQVEVRKRLVLALYFHDAELARIHHHDPILRHSLDRLPRLSSNELFRAPNAKKWKALLSKSTLMAQRPISHTHEQPPVHPPPILPTDFELCTMLQSISAIAYEGTTHKAYDPSSPTSSTVSKCHELLAQWHMRYQSTIAGNLSCNHHMILWHFVFIILHADLNSLECAQGRDGFDAAQRTLPYARNWARSIDAKRCLLHAMLLQKNFESLPTGAESAFHVNMCLYYCGILWATFTEAKGEGREDTAFVISAADHALFPELKMPGIDDIGNYLEQIGGAQPRKLAIGSLFRVIGLLQRISYWRIAQNLASTLLALVEDTPGLF